MRRTTMTRREVLKTSAGAAGLLAWPAAGRAVTDKPRKAPSSPVAIERCASFDAKALRKAYDSMFDKIDGIGKLVSGKTVTVKLNLTGMTWKPVFGLPAHQTYQTHPNTAAALCAALADAGAKRIILVENLYWERPVEESLAGEGWNVKEVCSAGHNRVTFEDTRNRGSFPGYSRFTVPWGGYIYPAFNLNQRFEKTDVLVSLAKLKQHACAGVTGAVKNCFGNTPCSLYGGNKQDDRGIVHRAPMFHGGRRPPPEGVPQELENDCPKKGQFRVPRITADIFGARPTDLNIVEGIRTISGGEGHWNRGIALQEPKVILAGRNGVCTDAVATAVMGFDPQAKSGQPPFQGDNHLELLARGGIGTNDPARIEVVGVPIREAVHPFTPKETAS